MNPFRPGVERILAGDPVPVSGVIIQPLTPAPPGGYPVVVWTHGTTGIGDDTGNDKFILTVALGVRQVDIGRQFAAQQARNAARNGQAAR